MNSISVLLDRHFPYSTSAFAKTKIKLKQLALPARLPKQLGRIYHVYDLYRQSFKADVVLGNRRSALILGLLYHVYKPKKISLIGYEIIFNFKDTVKARLVKLIWRIAVKKIDKLVVMTGSERQYLAREFQTSQDKIRTIFFYAENGAYIGPEPDGYIFAAGRMERDFETLIHAVTGTPYPTVIVADESQKEKLEKIKPSNVKILYNIPKEEYNKLLKNSKIVVVPLYNGAASRGQVVILEAMKFGKPVVCTRVEGTVDYLEHGKEGFFVAPSDPEELRNLFNTYFDDFKELEKIGKEAFQTQQNKYSPEVFHKNYEQLITEEWAKKKGLSEPAEREKNRKNLRELEKEIN